MDNFETHSNYQTIKEFKEKCQIAEREFLIHEDWKNSSIIRNFHSKELSPEWKIENIP